MSTYEKVTSFFVLGLWPLSWVKNAVGKWITAEEYQKITGQEYEKE